MAVVYNTTVRNNRLQQVVNAIDGGPGNGLLEIGTTGMGAVLSTVVLAKPCGTIAAGVLTFSGVPLNDVAAAGIGNAAAARITDSTGTTVISGLTIGTVGSSVTDMVISQASVDSGDIVSFVSGTIVGN